MLSGITFDGQQTSQTRLMPLIQSDNKTTLLSFVHRSRVTVIIINSFYYKLQGG